jgi:1,4-alpha-glucan branching enzyme
LKLKTSFWVVPEPKRLSAPDNYTLGFQRLSSNKVRISVQAPGKKHLFLLGDFNEWKINTDFVFNVSEDGTLHWIELDGVPLEKPFQYQLALNNTRLLFQASPPIQWVKHQV